MPRPNDPTKFYSDPVIFEPVLFTSLPSPAPTAVAQKADDEGTMRLISIALQDGDLVRAAGLAEGLQHPDNIRQALTTLKQHRAAQDARAAAKQWALAQKGMVIK